MNRRRIMAAPRPIMLLALTLLFPLAVVSEQRLMFEQITTSHGLSQNSVIRIFQDSRGFMWIGTREGLNRYDGFSFLIIKSSPADSNTLSNHSITSIAEDRCGHLWIGTKNGLNRLDPPTNRVTRYYPFGSSSSTANDIVTIVVDGAGNARGDRDTCVIWVGSAENGACRMRVDDSRTQIELFQHSPNDANTLAGNNTASIFRDQQGRVWIATAGEMLNEFNPLHSSFVRHALAPDSPPNAGVQTAFVDSRGQMWASISHAGLYHLTFESEEGKTVVKRVPIPISMRGLIPSVRLPNAIAEDARGNIWVSSYFDGIEKYELRSDGSYDVTQYRSESSARSGLPSNQVRTLVVDRSNLLWAGDDNYGLSKARLEERFPRFSFDAYDSTSLRAKSIRGIFELPDGKLLVGGYADLMTIDRKSGVIPQRYTNNDPRGSDFIHYVYCIAPDPTSPDSIVWLGLERWGLIRLNVQRNTIDDYLPEANNPDALLNQYVISLFSEAPSTLWIGTDGGLQRLDVTTYPSPKFQSYPHDERDQKSMSKGTVSSIMRAKSGILWVATLGGGVNAMLPDKPGEFLHLVHDPSNPSSLSSDKVKTIYEDRGGTLWIGTDGGGLNMLLPDGQSFRRFGEEDGLPNNTVYGILEDSHGNLWLSTNRGLSRFTPSTNEFWNFTVDDGLQDNEFNTGSYHRCKHGEMFFGGINGFNAFIPEDIGRNRYHPPVHITSIKLFDTELSAERIFAGAPLILRHDEDNLTFEFVSLDYSAPHRNKYKFRMEGINDDWISVGTRRYVSYARLSPGNYTFRVMGSNSDGLWSEQSASVSFEIEPPYWETLWFRILVAAFLLSIGPAFYVRRVRQLQRNHRLQQDFSTQLLANQENERKRIAGELHDSIGQNMLVMKNRAALGKETTDLQRKQTFFDEISDLVSRTLKELQEISYNLRPYELDRIGLTEAINAMFSTVKGSAKFQMRTSVENIDALFPRETGIHIYRIVQEGMNNVLKHSGASEVAVTIRRQAGSVLILIQDDGVGMDMVESRRGLRHHRGFGLSGLKERVQLLGGSIKVDSEPGMGMTLRVELPVRGELS